MWALKQVLEKSALASGRALEEMLNHMKVASETALRLSILLALRISDKRENAII